MSDQQRTLAVDGTDYIVEQSVSWLYNSDGEPTTAAPRVTVTDIYGDLVGFAQDDYRTGVYNAFFIRGRQMSGTAETVAEAAALVIELNKADS